MKIAIVSDDGVTISQHFGRAAYYVIVTVEDRQILFSELVDKLGHAHFNGEAHGETHDARGHGFEAGAQSRHTRMLDAIAGCQVLVGRGMGAGAFASIRAANITPIVTDTLMIADAIQQYMDGTLVHHPEKLH